MVVNDLLIQNSTTGGMEGCDNNINYWIDLNGRVLRFLEIILLEFISFRKNYEGYQAPYME